MFYSIFTKTATNLQMLLASSWLLCNKSKVFSLGNVSAYTADHVSVNYEKHNSVFKKLKAVKPDIIAANGLAHILHNASRYAFSQLCVDVENIVLKLFATSVFPPNDRCATRILQVC